MSRRERDGIFGFGILGSRKERCHDKHPVWEFDRVAFTEQKLRAVAELDKLLDLLTQYDSEGTKADRQKILNFIQYLNRLYLEPKKVH